MKNTNTLLSITNLKKYFPIAKSHIFQREQLYVRANEEINIDIQNGETFGLVGESGCGKSTLGRTILQLYDQTAGSTLYYGRTIDDFAPLYVGKTIKNAKKLIKKQQGMQAKANELSAEVDQAGENATFFQHQNKNLAIAESETAFQNIVKIIGGFAALNDPSEGLSAMLERYKITVKLRDLNEKARDFDADIALYEAMATEFANDLTIAKREAKIAAANKKAEAIRVKKNKLQPLIKSVERQLEAATNKLDGIRKKHASNGEFIKFEELRDNGIDLSRLKYSEMRILRKDIQIIFQDPYSSLNPRMTIGQIIGEGLTTHNFFKKRSPQMKNYILNIMDQCGLQGYMLHRYPHQFSGGQRQRICIARALAVKPKFIVCDECVSALDVSIQSQIINLLEELKEKENLTYLFISHDLSVVRYISDRIGVMYLGNMVELGTAEEIFADPRHPYTVALLSSIPTTDPDSATKERIILEGNIPSPIRPPEGCKFHTRCYMACEKCSRVPPPYVEVNPGHFVACHFLDKKIDENGNYLFDANIVSQEARTETAGE